MATQSIAAAALASGREAVTRESRKRASRWRFFNLLFVCLYLGIMLDIVTTAIGFMKAGSQYEQNPFGSAMIGHVGWYGLAALMTIISWVLYKSFKTVYWHMSLKWSGILNSVLVLLVAFRWLAVVTAVLFLLQP